MCWLDIVCDIIDVLAQVQQATAYTESEFRNHWKKTLSLDLSFHIVSLMALIFVISSYY